MHNEKVFELPCLKRREVCLPRQTLKLVKSDTNELIGSFAKSHPNVVDKQFNFYFKQPSRP